MFSSTRKRELKNESLLFPSISTPITNSNIAANIGFNASSGFNSSSGFNASSGLNTSSGFNTSSLSNITNNTTSSSASILNSNVNLNKLFSPAINNSITSPNKTLKDTFDIPTHSIKERIRTPYKNNNLNDDVKDKDNKNELVVNNNKLKYYDNDFKTSSSDNEFSDTIKVFGLSLDNVSNILAHFSKFGEIVRYEVSPLGGNWIVIQYKSEFGATHALSQNGILIDDTYMIGVIKAAKSTASSAGFKSKTFKQYSTSSLLVEKPRTSVCNEIMKYLFKW